MTDPKQLILFFWEVNNFGLNSVICQTEYILLLEYLFVWNGGILYTPKGFCHIFVPSEATYHFKIKVYFFYLFIIICLKLINILLARLIAWNVLL